MLRLSLLLGALRSSLGDGVRLEVFNNTALGGGVPESTSNTSLLSGAWSSRQGVLSAIWQGSLTPPANDSYAFNCSFVGGYGIAWVDGHVLCTHGMPLYAGDVGPGPLPLLAGRAYAVRMHFFKNDTAQADASAAMTWKIGSSGTAGTAGVGQAASALPALRTTHTRMQARMQGFIPAAALSPVLPSASAERLAALQGEQYARSAGWGSWYPHNLIAVTRLPDGAQLVFGLCQLSSGACQLTSVASSFELRLGAHAADGSYAQVKQPPLPPPLLVAAIL